MKNPIQIIIAEDQVMLREAIANYLSSKNVVTIAEAGNGRELLDLLEVFTPDIVLLDLSMPIMDGNEAMFHISKRFPETKVIILTLYESNLLVNDLILRGAKGYIPKNKNIAIIEEAIKKVLAGEIFITRTTEIGSDVITYTPKQVEVMAHLSDGLTNKEIAAEINISERCVEKHKQQIYAKNKMQRGFDFYKYAFNSGLQFLKKKI